jgi:hypothetical protein
LRGVVTRRLSGSGRRLLGSHTVLFSEGDLPFH